jgi:glucose/arabinose dehydrogenase
MMRPPAWALAVLMLVCGALWAAPAQALVLPAGFHDEPVFDGLQEPTALSFAPDGRVFVAEKSGEILVYDSLADSEPTIFADLRTEVYDFGDRGILGLALDPNFATNHYVYVLYTYDHLLGDPEPAPKWGVPNHSGDDCEEKPSGTGVDDCPVSGRLVRLTADGDEAAQSGGVPAEKVLVEDWCAQYSSHSVGDLEFGPEGALYASAGEGADANSPDYGQNGWPQKNQCGDPPGSVGEALSPPTAEGGSLRAQNTENLDGKVIRVDPETGKGWPGNPMAASANANQRRIVAYGFRNPFRFAIDPETSEVYVGNVGWNTYEEMDRFTPAPSPTPAYNSGWPCYEGPSVNAPFQSLELNVCKALYETPGSTAPPFFFYRHDQGVTPEDTCNREAGSAIAGLDFYDGDAFPASYKGALFFSDPVRECLYVMFAGKDGRPDPATTIPFLTEGSLYPGIDIQEGPEGALYYVKLFGEDFVDAGSIHRISYSADNQPPVARLEASPEYSVGDLTAEFDATKSSDADGEALEYEWDPQGDGSYEAATSNGKRSKTFTDHQNHTVAVRVKDQKGATSVDQITVYPHDTPPEPKILTPSPTLEWHVDQAIEFSGKAEDAEDGPLPPTSLDWDSRLAHCPAACHFHSLQPFSAVASGTLIAPDHDAPSHIDLSLTATDSRGLAATTMIELKAHEFELTLDSSPQGLSLSAGDQTAPTPFALPVIDESQPTVSAPQTVERDGATFNWSGWSDGGARVHAITITGPRTLTAEYTRSQDPAPSPNREEPSSPLQVPNTLLRTHPAVRTRKTTAKFVFDASAAGSHFRCKLDRKPLGSCSSPLVYRHLTSGKHALEIIAFNAAGSADPTPKRFRWTVEPPKPLPAS